MSRLACWIPVVLLAFLSTVSPAMAAPVPVGKTSLALVPEKAPLVLYLHGVQRTHDRFLVTLKAALPDLAPRVETQLDSWLKDGFNGRKLDSLEKEGPIFLAFLEMPHNFDKPPKMALIVAVTDYAKFRDGVLDPEQKKALKKGENGVEEAPLPFGDDKIYFLDRKGWAIIAADKESIETFTKDFKGLDNRISKEQGAKLLDADLGLYLSMDAFNKDYAEQIKAVKDAFNGEVLNQVEKLGTLDKATIKVFKTAAETAFQAAEDSQGFLATIEFRPAGFALHLQTELRANSATAKTMKEFKTASATDLSRLPLGQTSYNTMSTPPALLEGLAPFLLNVQSDPTGNEDSDLKAAIDKIVKAGPTERLGSTNWPLADLQVTKYGDAAKALEGQLNLYKAMKPNSGYQMISVKEKPAIKVKAEKYNSIDFDAIELVLDFEKTIERATAQQALPDEVKKGMAAHWKKRYGEKVHIWVGSDGKAVIQVTAATWKDAQKLLDAYFSNKGTLGDEAAFKGLVKELPAQASAYGLIDPVLYGLIQAEEFRLGFEGAAMGAIKLPANFPNKPEKHVTTYFGVAATLRPERASIDVFFSAKGVQECYKAFGSPFFNTF